MYNSSFIIFTQTYKALEKNSLKLIFNKPTSVMYKVKEKTT